MNTRWLLVALLGALLFGCDHSKEEKLQQQVLQLQSDNEVSQQALSARESELREVIRSINEVYADLELTRVREGQLSKRAGGAEAPVELSEATSQEQLLNSIGEIGATLKANRVKIGELESRVKSFRGKLAGLNTLVKNLKGTLQEREQSIAELQARVQGLESTVAEKTNTIVERDRVIDDQQKTMNTAYMIVGTRKQLKEKGIITDEGGFLWGLLGSTTVMARGVDQSLFTPIDMTRAQSLSVSGKIDDLLPHRNADLFARVEEPNNEVLTIIQPEKFWQEKYLVIVVD